MNTAPPSTPLVSRWQAWQTSVRELLRDAWAVVSGKECVVCGQAWGRWPICESCLRSWQQTDYRGAPRNNMERLFWSEPCVKRAHAAFWFHPHLDHAKIVYAFKYHGRKDVARFAGRLMALQLYDTDFFEGIDALMPVPIAQGRFRQRGYNQSEELAKGMAKVIGVPIITDAVIRYVDHPSQTTRLHTERMDNVANVFALVRPERLEGKRIVIIDDVITYSCTLLSLIRTMESVAGLEVHVMTLCAARRFRAGRLREADLHLPDCKATFCPNEVRRYRPSSLNTDNSEPPINLGINSRS